MIKKISSNKFGVGVYSDVHPKRHFFGVVKRMCGAKKNQRRKEKKRK